MKAITEKQLREVTVLVRYFVKATGSVVLYIENDKGARYYVTLNKNKQHHCSCPSVKPCYHIKQMASKENARYTASKAPSQVVQLPAGVAPVNGTLRVKGPALARETTDISTKGALTTNSGFQLMAS